MLFSWSKNTKCKKQHKLNGFIKSKRGDTVIVTIILIPVILFLAFYLAGSLGSQAIMQRRMQNAIDIILLDTSKSKSAVDVFEDGNYKTVCSLDGSETKNKELSDKYISEVVSKINGYNQYWNLEIKYNLNEQYQVYTSVTVKITAVYPRGVISNYTKWYNKNIAFSKDSTTAIITSLGGTAQCR